MGLRPILQIGTSDAIPGLLTAMRNQRSRHYKVRIIIVLLIIIAFSSLCYSFDNIILFSDTVLERTIEAGLSIIKVRIENVWIKKEIYADIYYYDVKVLNVLFGNYSKKSDSLSAGASYGSALSVGKTYIIFATEGDWRFLDSVIQCINNDSSIEIALAEKAQRIYSKTKLALKDILEAYLKAVKRGDHTKFGKIYDDQRSSDSQQFQEVKRRLADAHAVTTWKNGNFGYGLVVNRSGSVNSEPLFFYFVYKNRRWNLVYDSIVYPYPETPKETDIPKVDWEYVRPFDSKKLKKIEKEKGYLKSPMAFLRYLVSKRGSFATIWSHELNLLSGAENELTLKKYLESVQPCAGIHFPYESSIKFETTIGAAVEKILKQFKRANSRRDATTEK